MVNQVSKDCILSVDYWNVCKICKFSLTEPSFDLQFRDREKSVINVRRILQVRGVYSRRSSKRNFYWPRDPPVYTTLETHCLVRFFWKFAQGTSSHFLSFPQNFRKIRWIIVEQRAWMSSVIKCAMLLHPAQACWPGAPLKPVPETHFRLKSNKTSGNQWEVGADHFLKFS